jgi:LmbE family N-acetylglucosaminyl deacetylase
MLRLSHVMPRADCICMRETREATRMSLSTDQPQPAADGAAVHPMTMGPRTAATLCACAGVATASVLGVSWLAAAWIGIPLGLWVIAATAGAAHLVATRREQADLANSALLRSMSIIRERAEDILEDVRSGRAREDVMALVRSNLPGRESIIRFAASLEASHSEPQFARESFRRSSTSTRIGVDLPAAQSVAVLRASEECATARQSSSTGDGCPIVWFSTISSTQSRSLTPRRATVFVESLASEHGELTGIAVRSLRAAGIEPGWSDWSTPMPLGYASVFPLRVDPQTVTLPGVNIESPATAMLVARLAEAAGVLSQSAGRLGINKRPRNAQGVAQPRTPGAPERVMRDLAAALRVSLDAGSRDAATRAAARVLGAWSVTSDSTLTPEERLEIAALADRVINDEPESALRLAAAQFAVYSDKDAMTTLQRAMRMLRAAPQRCQADPLAFILSELELGSAGNLTLGRVAAGICLLWATAPRENLKYLRDDLMDDLRHAGWLTGREQDTELLSNLIVAMEKARGDEGQSQPVREAA